MSDDPTLFEDVFQPSGFTISKRYVRDLGMPVDDLVDDPELPYAGTSGWSGSETSKRRAEEADEDGRTGSLQRALLFWLRERDMEGGTVKEARERFPVFHHGSISGALTVLHKSGRIVRTSHERCGCQVYYDTAVLVAAEDLRPYRSNVPQVFAEAQAFAEAFDRWKHQPAGEDDWSPVMEAYNVWRLAQ